MKSRSRLWIVTKGAGPGSHGDLGLRVVNDLNQSTNGQFMQQTERLAFCEIAARSPELADGSTGDQSHLPGRWKETRKASLRLARGTRTRVSRLLLKDPRQAVDVVTPPFLRKPPAPEHQSWPTMFLEPCTLQLGASQFAWLGAGNPRRRTI